MREEEPEARGRPESKAYANLAKITSIHPNATFGPDDTEVTMRQLLRRSVEKTGHCIGVSVDKKGEFHVE